MAFKDFNTGEEAMVSTAPKRQRISQPSRGTRQADMTRKGYEKNQPAKMQGIIRVLNGKEGVPSTPMTEIRKGIVVPEGKVKAEKVAPVSTRKAMDLPTTWSIILGSVRVMEVTKSGQHQSSTRLRSSKARRVLDAGISEAGPLRHGIEDEPA